MTVLNQGRGAYGKSALKLTSPPMHGKDVDWAQHRLLEFRKAHPELKLPAIHRDGEYGVNTARLAKLFSLEVGEPAKFVNGTLGPEELQILADSHFRTGNAGWDRAARRRRQARVKKLAEIAARQTAGEKAVHYLRGYAGTEESPRGSNCGGVITQWQREAGTGCGAPYCGVGVIAAYRHGAGIRLPLGCVYVPNIDEYAKAGSYGFRYVSKTGGRIGDIMVFNFGLGRQHTGLLIAYLGGGKYHTIEANTSSGNGGSQDDGEGVWERIRYIDNVYSIVRPGGV